MRSNACENVTPFICGCVFTVTVILLCVGVYCFYTDMKNMHEELQENVLSVKQFKKKLKLQKVSVGEVITAQQLYNVELLRWHRDMK